MRVLVVLIVIVVVLIVAAGVLFLGGTGVVVVAPPAGSPGPGGGPGAAGDAGGSAPDATDPGPGDGTAAVGEPASASSELILFYGGEEQGYLEPCGCDDALIGGFPRRFTAMKSATRGGLPSIALQNGDLSEEPGDQKAAKYGFQIQALSTIGCRVMNVGDRDLMMGVDFLQQMRSQASFPLVSANLLHAPEMPVFDEMASFTVEVGGQPRQVVVVGVLADSLGPYAEQQGLVFRPAREAVEATLAKAGAAELRVVLFHGDASEAAETLSGIDGIDLVVAGHEQDEPFDVRAEGAPPVVGPGIKGKKLARVGVSFDGGRATVGPSTTVELTNRIPDEPSVVPILEEYYALVQASGFDEGIPLKALVGGSYVGSKTCFSEGGCHDREYQILAASKHGHALETLKKKKRDRDPECIVCHVVGFGYESGFRSESATPDLGHVGCESCHGVGSRHSEDPENELGFTGREKSCLPCHDPENSPKFDFEEYWEKIKH